MKEEKSGGVVGEEDECGDDAVGLLERDDEGWIFCLWIRKHSCRRERYLESRA